MPAIFAPLRLLRFVSNIQVTHALNYLRDVASAVLATETWLGGWMSRVGIVSKRLNLS